MDKVFEFISQENDIRIRITKKKISKQFSFSNNQDYNIDRYMYTMDFINSLGTLIKSINISDTEMIIMIENFNFFYLSSYQDSIVVTLSCKDFTGKFNSFLLESNCNLLQSDNNENNYNSSEIKQTLKLLEYNIDGYTTIVTIEVSNSLLGLIDILYSALYFDENDIVKN